MLSRRLRRFVVPCVVVAAGLSACRPAAEPALLIRDVTVVDGREPRPRAGLSVLVEGDRIASVGPVGSLRPPRGARVVEAGGLYLVPGLWDMHTHALWEPFASDGSLALFVANGVTGIRDMGGELEVLRRLRAPEHERGAVEPRIVASGPWLNLEELDPRAGRAVATAAEARRAVAELARAGADFVKVYTGLPREAFLAVLEEAGGRDLPVAGHVPLDVGARRAAELGMRSIEHMQAETGGYCSPGESGDCGPLFETFRRHRTWQTPTLVPRRNRAHLDDAAVVEAPSLRFAPAALRAEWEAVRTERLASMDADELEAVRERFAAERRLAAALIRADVPILVGSDAGELYSLAGFSLHDELELLVEAGMTPSAALRAATLGAAEFLGLEDRLGTVEAGKLADLILLEADPSENIAHTRRLRAVVLDGRLLDRPALDRLLAVATHPTGSAPRTPSDEAGRVIIFARMKRRSQEITRLLQEWSDGEPEAFDKLSERVYPELKKLARAHYRRERPGGTLQPTALVNEAYLRLVGQEGGSWRSRLQFFKFASSIMRHVLMDYFRARKAVKRGGGEAKVSFDEAIGTSEPRDMDLVRLQDALESLERINPLHSRIVELRFFGGLTVDEVAEELGLTRAKVKREWSAVRSWLFHQVATKQ